MSPLLKDSKAANATVSRDSTDSGEAAVANMLASSPSQVARLLLVLNSPKWSRVGDHFANVIVKIAPTVRIIEWMMKWERDYQLQ